MPGVGAAHHNVCWPVCVVLQTSSESQMKKLEEQLSEANRRGDDLQRALTELSVAKNRLTGTVHLKEARISSCSDAVTASLKIPFVQVIYHCFFRV